ncbi:Cys-tRNA(Pro) deacylase, partial [Chryseobacterium gambrini]|nr:Cys-tRNA(Pro) deacylase [Chryseobacterium gambrini]
MTPAILMLEKLNIPFTILSYEHDPKNTQFGYEAVEKLN